MLFAIGGRLTVTVGANAGFTGVTLIAGVTLVGAGFVTLTAGGLVSLMAGGLVSLTAAGIAFGVGAVAFMV
jgi:hypothetical protein